ncbi:uncharacterized protein LOC122016173 [Zingiber officinale]|uniref:Uncharacterized protein n=1 Tax=Zingiber officinale TaxID=94328 RepID=A0A8J5KC29_ZINOF|nr:uncharacterized protein LOC122011387 [Zingiber officinale]XP_042429333.1 uncharacterized protein LOC122016173 [Zingiber officinale]KAG6481216.1 hypothetical protein ZIOFF_057812 [Zingiber officinale]KAG6485070.1 hypothetical protein ZIOFF_053599 [Zingiber officinale]
MASEEIASSIYDEANSYKMSRLRIESEGDDADVEPSSEDEGSKGGARGGGGRVILDDDSFSGGGGISSMPGTPDRVLAAQEWTKEYASETEAARGRGARRRPHLHGRIRRDRWLEQVWQRRKSHAAEEDYGSSAGAECRVLVRPLCGSGRMSMDMEEVRACRDLGIGLSNDWTVEIPETFSDLTADTSSGGNSPVNWISSPGDNPKDVKARIRAWAQAVALTSTSRFNS